MIPVFASIAQLVDCDFNTSCTEVAPVAVMPDTCGGAAITITSKMTAVNRARKKLLPIRRSGWNGMSLGYDAEEEYLKNVIRQVVVGNSEGIKVSTSLMIYGSPGCGKSWFVDKVIQQVAEECENGSDNETEESERVMFDIVKLNGVYCSNLQDSVQEICNGILDSAGDIMEVLGVSETTPFDERLEAVLFYLKNKLQDLKKALVIVIDGMEKFVDDSSQRLLYNLFDISANSSFRVPICVIGITPCVDILDLFEKRVRSRFSHRQINLIPKIEFPVYQQWALTLLSLTNKDEHQAWNRKVEEVLGDRQVVIILRALYEGDRSIGQLKRLLYVATLMVDDELTPSCILDAYSQIFGMQCHVLMALDLPLSELVVLLGIYKKIQRSLQAWQPSEVFEIIRKPYALYQLRKEDFIKTIMRLQDLELIVGILGNRSRNIHNIMDSYYKCEISYTEFKDIWAKYPNLPSFFNEYL